MYYLNIKREVAIPMPSKVGVDTPVSSKVEVVIPISSKVEDATPISLGSGVAPLSMFIHLYIYTYVY